MTGLRRLLTLVHADGAAADTSMSYSARHEAELTDGRRVQLLDGRGWTTSGPPDLRIRTTVADIVSTARMVVGPDEPRPDWSPGDEAAAHYRAIAAELERHGVQVDAAALPGVPHDVEVSPELLARLSH